MSDTVTLAGRAEWLADPHLQRMLGVLSEGGEQARIAGGAVRNALLGEPVADVDIATTTLPDGDDRGARGGGLQGGADRHRAWHDHGGRRTAGPSR